MDHREEIWHRERISILFIYYPVNGISFMLVLQTILRDGCMNTNLSLLMVLKKYHIHRLVYFEETDQVDIAILREKQLKKWSRKKKNRINQVHQSRVH